MSPLVLLASGDPFQHTWNTWELSAFGLHLDLRTVPGFEKLGISNVVLMMFVVALLLLVVGFKAGAEAKRALAENRTPRGLAHCVEVVVEFVREQIVRPQMPHHFEKPFYNAFFCTIFFFILANNLIGLAPEPFGHTPTGLFWLNLFLAFGGTFLVMIGGGMAEKGPLKFWASIVPHGVPWWLWPMLFVIEFFGLLIKPFALTIRLTANMTAGHIILAVLMSFLTLGLKDLGGAAFGVYPASAFGYLAITAFEIAIAFIQAYIFTTLSAVFVGMSLSHEH